MLSIALHRSRTFVYFPPLFLSPLPHTFPPLWTFPCIFSHVILYFLLSSTRHLFKFLSPSLLSLSFHSTPLSLSISLQIFKALSPFHPHSLCHFSSQLSTYLFIYVSPSPLSSPHSSSIHRPTSPSISFSFHSLSSSPLTLLLYLSHFISLNHFTFLSQCPSLFFLTLLRYSAFYYSLHFVNLSFSISFSLFSHSLYPSLYYSLHFVNLS